MSFQRKEGLVIFSLSLIPQSFLPLSYKANKPSGSKSKNKRDREKNLIWPMVQKNIERCVFLFLKEEIKGESKWMGLMCLCGFSQYYNK